MTTAAEGKTTAVQHLVSERLPMPTPVEVEPGIRSIAPENQKTDPYSMARFDSAGTLALTDEQQKILSEPLKPDEIQFDADRGLYYAGHAVIRHRLNRAFGIGAWAMVPVDRPMFSDGEVLSTWDLYVQGKYVARATGEQIWIETNRRMTRGDALEGSRSNALVRCCKDLGIGIELWNKNYIAKLKANGKPQTAAVASPARKSAKVEKTPASDDVMAEIKSILAEYCEAPGDINTVLDECGGFDVDGKHFAPTMDSLAKSAKWAGGTLRKLKEKFGVKVPPIPTMDEPVLPPDDGEAF